MPLNAHNRRQIALLAGEDLSPADTSAAERSVHSCPDCRGHFESVRDGLTALGDSACDAHPGTPSLWPGMRTHLTTLAPAPAANPRWAGWAPLFAVTAASLLAAVFAFGPQWGDAAGSAGGRPAAGTVFRAGDELREPPRVDPRRAVPPEVRREDGRDFYTRPSDR